MQRDRLQASPNFVLASAMDGRPYLAKEVEPYQQFWLSERERLLFALFARRGGLASDRAVDSALRLTAPTDQEPERKRLLAAIEEMRSAGVLIETGGETSRYGARMAKDYLTFRPFPRPVANEIVASASIGKDTSVLDLAGGPGSLALELARASDRVSMMDLSKGFLAAARRRAHADGLKLETIHESCNRLVFLDGAFEVITISQALHWLDDVMVCRGIHRLLRDGGSFFVVHGALSLPDAHPLSYILGDRTPLGDKSPLPFEAQAQALLRRLSLLFEALDVEVERVGASERYGPRIAPAGLTFFRQRRPVGEGFARAFLSPGHIAPLGISAEDFWADLARRCRAASPEALIGVQDWALLHFRRDGRQIRAGGVTPGAWREIGWDGPA